MTERDDRNRIIETKSARKEATCDLKTLDYLKYLHSNFDDKTTPKGPKKTLRNQRQPVQGAQTEGIAQYN